MYRFIHEKLLTRMTTFNKRYRKLSTNISVEKRRGNTIYALSSGHGKCGVAVVRVSGAKALDALNKMTNISKLEPRKAFLRTIYDPETREIIDKGICLWFPEPKSFTGEHCVEFHVHGGPAILLSLTSALSKLNFYPALPGEFTRRAFFNNKLDLVEIEGLADLIHAETEQQRRQALSQANGYLSKIYNDWRNMLIKIAANLEAYIDFHEEDNIEGDILGECASSVDELKKIIQSHLADKRKGEILRNGIRTVIIGEPNVGKSTLLNHLVRRNAAIVSPIAGTTRDIIELSIDISGYPVILADTAGLTNHAQDMVEVEGIRRATAYARTADFVILMIDANNYSNSKKTYDDYLKEYIVTLQLHDILINDEEKHFIVVMNKIDLLQKDIVENLRKESVVTVSCQTEEGFEDLMKFMTEHLRNICGNVSNENPTISQTRYRTHLSHCLEHLCNYTEISSNEEYDLVIAVQEVRMAMRELGKITGHVSNDEILDIIFKNFCIGK